MFKIVTSSPADWMPPHYVALEKSCLENAAKAVVNPMMWGMEISSYPEPFVKHLSSAASKYRLASVCEGLSGGTTETAGWAKVGADYFDRYSAQAIIMLTFVALESHLRMLGATWQKFPIRRTAVSEGDLSKILRESLENPAFTSLRKAMKEKKLQKRMDRFWDGDDREALAVISALRNSFSHGKAGVKHSISLESAKEIKQLLLEMIKSDAELITLSLDSQNEGLVDLTV